MINKELISRIFRFSKLNILMTTLLHDLISGITGRTQYLGAHKLYVRLVDPINLVLK